VFWPLLVTLLIGDCTTKQLAERYLPEHTPLEIGGTVFRLTLAHNPDGAMSLSLGPYSRIGFSLAALGALAVLAGFYRTAPAGDRLRIAGLALIAGGALGNLLNRLFSPAGVVDFIDVGLESWRFWTFNVADAGITIGAILLGIALWRETSAAPPSPGRPPP
jgi:signal peptidase II